MVFQGRELMDDVIIDIQGIEFPPETEEWAITLAAFDVMKKLYEEGRISKEELEFIAKKREYEVFEVDKS
jgi:hypothetical protein